MRIPTDEPGLLDWLVARWGGGQVLAVDTVAQAWDDRPGRNRTLTAIVRVHLVRGTYEEGPGVFMPVRPIRDVVITRHVGGACFFWSDSAPIASTFETAVDKHRQALDAMDEWWRAASTSYVCEACHAR